VNYRLRHADGRRVWIDTYGSVTARDANAARAHDRQPTPTLTERKQMERALGHTLRVMQALLETPAAAGDHPRPTSGASRWSTRPGNR
jgi:hypothetical protein